MSKDYPAKVILTYVLTANKWLDLNCLAQYWCQWHMSHLISNIGVLVAKAFSLLFSWFVIENEIKIQINVLAKQYLNDNGICIPLWWGS